MVGSHRHNSQLIRFDSRISAALFFRFDIEQLAYWIVYKFLATPNFKDLSLN